MSLAEALLDLQELTRQLRRECPWDREQTARTIVPHTVEEAYEVADAAMAGDDGELRGELGDLLFQVYFLALLLEESGNGDLETVAREAHAKLVRRHPHVFGDGEARTAKRVRERWEELKTEQEGREGIFHDVPAVASGVAPGAQGAAAGGNRRLRLAGSGGPIRESQRRDRRARRRGRLMWASNLPRRRPMLRCFTRSATFSSRW